VVLGRIVAVRAGRACREQIGAGSGDARAAVAFRNSRREPE
jgi:hypothetical protein